VSDMLKSDTSAFSAVRRLAESERGMVIEPISSGKARVLSKSNISSVVVLASSAPFAYVNIAVPCRMNVSFTETFAKKSELCHKAYW